MRAPGSQWLCPTQLVPCWPASYTPPSLTLTGFASLPALWSDKPVTAPHSTLLLLQSPIQLCCPCAAPRAALGGVRAPVLAECDDSDTAVHLVGQYAYPVSLRRSGAIQGGIALPPTMGGMGMYLEFQLITGRKTFRTAVGNV